PRTVTADPRQDREWRGLSSHCAGPGGGAGRAHPVGQADGQMRGIALLILAATLLPAQTAPKALSREEEQRLLQEDVSQAGNSPVDFIRAGERHLKRFPNSLIRDDL